MGAKMSFKSWKKISVNIKIDIRSSEPSERAFEAGEWPDGVQVGPIAPRPDKPCDNPCNNPTDKPSDHPANPL